MSSTNEAAGPAIAEAWDKISTPHVVSIQGGELIPEHFCQQAPEQKDGSFVVYNYPIGNQRASKSEPSRECSYKYQSTLDLKTLRVPDGTNEVDIQDVRIVDLGHDLGFSRFQALYDAMDKEADMTEGPKVNFPTNLEPRVSIFGHRAIRESEKRFRLFVSFPHICWNSKGGYTLQQYREKTLGQEQTLGSVMNPTSNNPLEVAETRFLLFDSEMIAVATTAEMNSEKVKRRQLPFFPNQHRASAEHLLVHMLSITLASDVREVLNFFRKVVEQTENRFRTSASMEASEDKPDKKEAGQKTRKALSKDLILLLQDISSVHSLIETQMQLLDHFEAMIWKADRDKPDPGYNANIIDLPIRFDGHSGRRIIAQGIGMVRAEQESYRKSFEKILGKGKGLQDHMLRHITAEQSQVGTVTMAEHAAQMKMSAATMSLFTVVTTLFLPLSFFTSYYALTPPTNTSEQNQAAINKFWQVSGPVTIMFTLGTLYVVLCKKFESGEYSTDRPIVKIFWWILGKFDFLKRKESSAQDPEDNAEQGFAGPNSRDWAGVDIALRDRAGSEAKVRDSQYSVQP